MDEQTLKVKEVLKGRIISIDALRGLVMFIILSTQIGGAPIFTTFGNMVWNNNWPHAYAWQLTWANQHPNFLNIAQPTFLFVVGLVIPFALTNRLARKGKARTYLHIVIRCLVLFLFGLIAGGKLLNLPSYNRTLATMPLYNNVLQYIGISYLICSIIVLNTNTKMQYIITAGLLLLYWAIWLFIPAPGWQGDRYSYEMNIAYYLDKIVLGKHGNTWGPYGLTAVLATINNIPNMLLGVLMGKIIFSSREKLSKTRLLFTWGSGMVAAGLIWGQFFPIMAARWSSSWVLVTCGIATLLLASFYLIIDVWGYSKWAFFFIVFGANSIAIYMMAHTFDFRLIGNVLVGGISSLFSPNVEAFIKAVTAMVIMWLIMLYMYRKRTFLKI